MENKTAAQRRKEAFLGHAQTASMLANTALDQIDMVLRQARPMVYEERPTNPSDTRPALPDRFSFDLTVIDSVLSESGLQL